MQLYHERQRWAGLPLDSNGLVVHLGRAAKLIPPGRSLADPRRQARKVDPIPIPKSPRKLERTHHRGPTPRLSPPLPMRHLLDARTPAHGADIDPPEGPASLAGSTFGRIEYCSAVQLKGTPRAIKQSRPQRFADLTKLCSATANYDMWASAAEPSNSEDSKCK